MSGPAPHLPARLSTDWLLQNLSEAGWLDDAAVRRARGPLRDAEATGKHILVALGELELTNALQPDRIVTTEALTRWLGERAALPYAHIDPLKVDVTSVTAVMTYAYAARAHILPIKVTKDTVTIAVADPFARGWEAELGGVIKRQVARVVANPADIDRYLIEFYALSSSVKASELEQRQARGGQISNLEQLMDLGATGKVEANDQHVVAIVDWLLQYAFQQRASDIHLEPRRDMGKVRFRIDGVLHEVYQMPAKVMAAVDSRLKILGRMDVAEKRRPQDGRIKTRSPDGQEIELRLSTMPTTFGEKLVMRVFDPDVLLKNFQALGLDDEETTTWKGLIRNPHGIVLVTGPTGSGKTTTLYSTLKYLAKPEVNVCTIEDPIELVDPAFNQLQVQSNIDLGFATGVRTVLRQDPDIIMVGEIRDLETADIAVQAALTGHLVLSTLHTNDAPATINRLLDLGLPAYLIRATLLGVVAQRLVRVLCPNCRKSVAPHAEDWRELAGPDADMPSQVYEAEGCLECRGTGFAGRVGLYELMTVSNSVRHLIQTETDTPALGALARSQGMRPLRVAGTRKVLAGVTSIAEVLRVTPPAGHN